MVNGVSDLSKNRNLERMTKIHQQEVDQSRKRISSGRKYSSYSELAKDNNIKEVTIRKSQISKLSNDYNVLLKVKGFMEVTDIQIESLLDVATSFKTILVKKNSLAGNSIDLTARANDSLQDIQKILTYMHNGQYIFSGSKTDKSPISNDLTLINNIANDQAIDNYYQGSSRKLSINNNHILEYSITGNHLSFQNLIGALNYAKDPLFLSQAGKTLDLSIKNLIDLRAQFGYQMLRVEQDINRNQEAISNHKLKLSETLETDLLEESTKLSQATLALEASYRLISSTKDLSLSKLL
jgi:flagellar hook-associated protein 3 FlgL